MASGWRRVRRQAGRARQGAPLLDARNARHGVMDTVDLTLTPVEAIRTTVPVIMAALIQLFASLLEYIH